MCPRKAVPSFDRNNPYYQNGVFSNPFVTDHVDQIIKTLDELDATVKEDFYFRGFHRFIESQIGEGNVLDIGYKQNIIMSVAKTLWKLDYVTQRLTHLVGDNRIELNPHLHMFYRRFRSIGQKAVAEDSKNYHVLFNEFERTYNQHLRDLSSDDMRKRRHRFIARSQIHSHRIERFIDNHQRSYPHIKIKTYGLSYQHPGPYAVFDPVAYRDINVFISQFRSLITRTPTHKNRFTGFLVRPTYHTEMGPYWILNLFQHNRSGTDWEREVVLKWIKDIDSPTVIRLLREPPETYTAIIQYHKMISNRDNLLYVDYPKGMNRTRHTVN